MKLQYGKPCSSKKELMSLETSSQRSLNPVQDIGRFSSAVNSSTKLVWATNIKFLIPDLWKTFLNWWLFLWSRMMMLLPNFWEPVGTSGQFECKSTTGGKLLCGERNHFFFLIAHRAHYRVMFLVISLKSGSVCSQNVFIHVDVDCSTLWSSDIGVVGYILSWWNKDFRKKKCFRQMRESAGPKGIHTGVASSLDSLPMHVFEKKRSSTRSLVGETKVVCDTNGLRRSGCATNGTLFNVALSTADTSCPLFSTKVRKTRGISKSYWRTICDGRVVGNGRLACQIRARQYNVVKLPLNIVVCNLLVVVQA